MPTHGFEEDGSPTITYSAQEYSAEHPEVRAKTEELLGYKLTDERWKEILDEPGEPDTDDDDAR